MRTLLIVALVVLTKTHNVKCHAVFDFMTSKFYEITNTIADTFKNIKEKVKLFFYGRLERTMPDMLDQSVINERIQKAFSDFVEKTAAESETESPEYNNFKSEPTALMSTPQLATLHGWRVESHVIQTKDGYLITLHRVLSAAQNQTSSNGQIILLHHGLLGSSADWILLGPEKSLPYLLSRSGYDVWMANARGNYYSRGHVTKKVDSRDFWKFSWQEMGKYDLAAVIDYIRQFRQTDEPIDFIGHSMGATALLVLLSVEPQYNKYLRTGILLAPLAFMTNIEGPLKILTTMASNPPEHLLNLLGDGEFVPTRKIPKWLASKYCKGPRIYCTNPLLFFSGGIREENTWNASFVARLLYHVPAGGSTDTILHYAQIVKNGKFHKFGDVSSEFPLSQITLPIALFSSSEDWLATIPDILRLYFSIANPIDHYIIRGKNLSHTDFVWGTDANTLVFSKVMEFLENGITMSPMKMNEVQ